MKLLLLWEDNNNNFIANILNAKIKPFGYLLATRPPEGAVVSPLDWFPSP